MEAVIPLSAYSAILGITTLIVLINYFTAPRMKKLSPLKEDRFPAVTICIPARNEEINIAQCLNAVLSQDYPEFDVLVLDDDSEDTTGTIIDQYVSKDSRVKKLSGKPLPSGWTGKNYACHNLAQKSHTEWILFIDADCIIASHAVSTAMSLTQNHGLKLLSSFPRQITGTVSEKLIVPIMNWILLTFLPLRLIYLSPWLSFTAANGQFMLFNRHAYDIIGGHESVRDRFVEDMELARLMKLHRFRIMTALGDETISCRMYRSFTEGINGFSKNFYPGFKTTVPVFSLFLAFIAGGFFIPFFLPFTTTGFIIFPLLIILQRFFIALMCKDNIPFSIIAHPAQMIITLVIGIKSMVQTKKKKLVWKGRPL